MSQPLLGMPFSTWARQYDLNETGALSSSEFVAAVDQFLSLVVSDLKEAGCEVIGHIKGVVESDRGNTLFFNVTSFDEPARYCGGIFDSPMTALMTVNAIVGGLDNETVGAAVERAVVSAFGESSFE